MLLLMLRWRIAAVRVAGCDTGQLRGFRRRIVKNTDEADLVEEGRIDRDFLVVMRMRI